MTMQITDQDLKQALDKASADVREVLSGDDLGPTLGVIGEKHGISDDQVIDLENIVVNTFLGLVSFKDFSSTIQKEIGVDETVAKTLASEITKIVFAPYQEDLAVTHGLNADSQELKTLQEAFASVKDIGAPSAPESASPVEPATTAAAAPPPPPPPPYSGSMMPKKAPTAATPSKPATAFEQKLRQTFKPEEQSAKEGASASAAVPMKPGGKAGKGDPYREAA